MPETESGAVLDALRTLLLDRAKGVKPLLVGLTGSVAAGKTTLCRRLAARLAPEVTVEALSTDGFLMDNAALEARSLVLRKGFPETYDAQALFAALAQVRTGPTPFPGYSHTTYEVDPALTRIVDRPDILLLEGLAFSPFSDGRTLADSVDLLIYLDAAEEDLETWFAERFMALGRAAAHEPTSFYAQFRHLSPDQADAFGRMVWARINLPNLREHIVFAKERAQIVLRKTQAHALQWVRGPLGEHTSGSVGAE